MSSGLKLKERFEQDGSVRYFDRVSGGSPVVVTLAPAQDLKGLLPMPAILTLARRHVPPLRAKRAIEAVMEDGCAWLEIPAVEDVETVRTELCNAGIAMRELRSPEIDVRRIRTKIGLTQEQFSYRYGIDIATLRNWEQGRFKPDQAARNFLRLIATNPREIETMLWRG